jgi:4-methylaminobutanoate oxidase (formaldehyde-forming)
MALARSFGVEVHDISPMEVAQRVPLLRTDDLSGAVWLPGDGKANPADLTMSLAKGARQRGVKIFEGVEVTGLSQAQGQVRGVQTLAGDVSCEIVVNCAGQWARQLGLLAGVNVPLYSAEHFYLVTGKIDGIHPMWPVVRDPDGFIYYKEEVGGLVMGGFEPVAKPWRVDPIPATFQFQLLGEDWDQFEVLMRSALHRTPCLETADVKMLLNGPESFTPDGNFIMGEAPELRHYYVCAGFNSAGIANAGGAGRLMAEWMVAGEPSADLWDVDIRRFAPFNGNNQWLRARVGEARRECLHLVHERLMRRPQDLGTQVERQRQGRQRRDDSRPALRRSRRREAHGGAQADASSRACGTSLARSGRTCACSSVSNARVWPS